MIDWFKKLRRGTQAVLVGLATAVFLVALVSYAFGIITVLGFPGLVIFLGTIIGAVLGIAFYFDPPEAFKK